MYLNQLFLLLYCALIFWLSDQPVLSIPVDFPHIDKLIHAGAYFIMGLLAWRAFTPWLVKPILLTIVFCSLYGLSDEWHQSIVAGRSSDVFDWIADTIGGVCSVLLIGKIKMLQKYFSKH